MSLHTEAQHHTIWSMSDSGIPRSYRIMEGFGVHTFRLVNADGETSLAKFHWKPKLGVHSLTWEEAQMIGGIDLLDPTKIVPEEIAPVQPIGRMALNATTCTVTASTRPRCTAGRAR